MKKTDFRPRGPDLEVRPEYQDSKRIAEKVAESHKRKVEREPILEMLKEANVPIEQAAQSTISLIALMDYVEYMVCHDDPKGGPEKASVLHNKIWERDAAYWVPFARDDLKMDKVKNLAATSQIIKKCYSYMPIVVDMIARSQNGYVGQVKECFFVDVVKDSYDEKEGSPYFKSLAASCEKFASCAIKELGMDKVEVVKSKSLCLGDRNCCFEFRLKRSKA